MSSKDRHKNNKQVCIQGLGFVGSAMAIAIASSITKLGKSEYQVIGVDLLNDTGRARVDAINRGTFPFLTDDSDLKSALSKASAQGRITATTDEAVYETADIIVVDVPLDLNSSQGAPVVNYGEFIEAVRTIGRHVREGALIVIETTVPPGTCEKIVVPTINEELERRNLSRDSVLIAHSFERVMPGSNYLKSITNYWRVYAGYTVEAADACEDFLSDIINVKDYPLTRLANVTSSEVAKVLENSYRAVNIAFVDEWTKFSERLDIDLFSIIDAIQMRPTHSNIRYPGLGVGGYCLTKDPLFGPAAARDLHSMYDVSFPFSTMAIQINEKMPGHTVERLARLFNGAMSGKEILLCGVAYRSEVGDTRHSPSETLVRMLERMGATVTSYDPFVTRWKELERHLPETLPEPRNFDAVVFAVPHKQFKELDLSTWLSEERPIILDTANIFNGIDRSRWENEGIKVHSIGRGQNA